MSPYRGFSPLLLPAGGDEEIRTLDPLLAGQVLSQLSYTPDSLSHQGPFFFRDPENRTTIRSVLARNSSRFFFRAL